MIPELCGKLVPMRLLHDKDELRPFHEVRCYRVFGIIVEAGRDTLDTRIGRKHLLCRRAAQAVLATNKENMLHIDPGEGQHSSVLQALQCRTSPVPPPKTAKTQLSAWSVVVAQ